jgi:Zn-dependent peptidase ImmA (M78 family)
VIDPVQIFKDLGYAIFNLDSLGQFEDIDGEFEAAGQVDPTAKVIWISRRFSPEVARFTAAHELGHAMLHRGMSLHRDRPVDGAHPRRKKTPEEADADYFAACLLMPDQLVRDGFAVRFLTTELVLNEEVAFALGFSDLQAARASCRTREELARLLAGAKFYNLRHFVSLAEQFGVSVQTMAIRLQELELVTAKALRKW